MKTTRHERLETIELSSSKSHLPSDLHATNQENHNNAGHHEVRRKAASVIIYH
jgi:hypothetical protein